MVREMYDSMTGYPLDTRDGETEDAYLDRMIELSDPAFAGFDAEARARLDATADFSAQCEKTVMGGRCTMCEASSYELLPWSGERICWDCFDHQLDLMAKAIREAGAEAFLVFGENVPEPFEAVEA